MRLAKAWIIGLLLFGVGTAVADEPKGAAVEPTGLNLVGAIVPRHAKEITSSHWSIGAETMDRDFTIYKHWREYLGPLGVKTARIQSGWAKTEQKRGQYDWAWLDEIILDMTAQGVRPWVCLCYGNPIYEGGGNASSASPLPSSPAALAAWDRFVREFVRRYKDQVNEWEIWNEPQHQKISIVDYAALVIRTGEILRAEQPTAKIFVVAAAGVGIKEAKGLLDILKKEGKLPLVNAVTYHPYAFNPNGDQGDALRHDVREYSKGIDIFQGECGIPSTPVSYGALAAKDNTELRQAKWAGRRLLSDLGHDIRSSYFSIADMHYMVDGELRINSKGLLATKSDKTVDHPKPAYRAVQHVTAVFDDALRRVSGRLVTVTRDGQAVKAIEAYLYERSASEGRSQGGHVLTLWQNVAPGESMASRPVDVTVPGGRFADPVFVDMLSGRVYALPVDRVLRNQEAVAFRAIPVGDWAVLLADRSALPCRIVPVEATAK